MRKLVSVSVFVGVLVACGSDMAEEAGEMLHDAGQVIADAGMMLSDAGRDDASAQTDAGSDNGGDEEPRLIEHQCDVVRYIQSLQDPYLREDKWSSVEVSMASVRMVWLCSPGAPVCPSGKTCTGAELPVSECTPASDFYYASGKLWTHCTQYSGQTVRVSVD